MGSVPGFSFVAEESKPLVRGGVEKSQRSWGGKTDAQTHREKKRGREREGEREMG